MESEYPLNIVYCPICTLPPEYCEFGPSFSKCKKWIAENCPEVYPDLAEQFEKIRLGEEVVEETKAPQKKKVKLELPQEIKLAPLKRGGKKIVIRIEGLGSFGVNLKDCAKDLRKKLSCGCSVVDDTIEVQGNLIEEIKEILCQNESITEDHIKVAEATTKKKKKGK